MTRLWILCPGLDHAARGFEAHALECFHALRDHPGLDVTLVKGSGRASSGERRAPTLRRETRPARWLARRLGLRAYDVEQYLFAAAAVPLVSRGEGVIMLSDWETARSLVRWRALTRRPYRLLFTNGAPRKPPFDGIDLVQQVTPVGLREALAAGEPRGRHVMLPHAIAVEPGFRPLGAEERHALRQRLGLPGDRPLVISVAAVKRSHKRVDYIVEELARLPSPRPFLLLLGQREHETGLVLDRARELLAADDYALRTIPHADMADYYRAADLLVMASLREGFGLVFVEAMAQGLRCATHDHEVARFVLGEHGLLGDLRGPGGLAALVDSAVTQGSTPEEDAARHRFALERFSWAALRERYVEMVEAAASPS